MGLGGPAGSWVTESHPQQAFRHQQERREEAAASELVIPFALKTPAVVCPESLQLHVKSQTLCKFSGLMDLAKERGLEPDGGVSREPSCKPPPASQPPTGSGQDSPPGNAASPRQTTPGGAPFPRVATCTWVVLARG